MPTATLTTSPTVSSTPFIPLKVAATAAPIPRLATISTSSLQQQNTAATLRPLYARAVRAFLHRDIVLTHSLLASAFALLTPPSTNAPDSLSELRRKWDVLRITLEVTVYAAPPADTASVPATLRSNALLSGAALLATLHSRSVRLFAPVDSPAPNPARLPAQVLVTLALSSAKIGCPSAGRGIIEEWLACRLPAAVPEDGYEKVLEVYCLSILPALGEWAYARQFLQYETELPTQSRERLTASLASLHEQYLASLVRKSEVDPPSTSAPVPSTSSARQPTLAPASTSAHTEPSSAVTPTPSRPSSPTPSSSSASSNSTHTAVPANPHRRISPSGTKHTHSLVPLTPTPSTATLTPASYRASYRAATANASPARRSRTPATAESHLGSSWLALTRGGAASSWLEALRPYLRHAPLFILCVVFPALAVLISRRRHKAAAAAAAAGAGAEAGVGAAARTKAVQDVRRRLSGVQGRRGLLSAVWDETVRAIWDTVVMGGRGLV